MIPSVDSKVMVTSDCDDAGGRHSWVCVGRDVGDGGVGQELHDHTNIILYCSKHHRRLKQKQNLKVNGSRCRDGKLLCNWLALEERPHITTSPRLTITILI